MIRPAVSHGCHGWCAGWSESAAGGPARRVPVTTNERLRGSMAAERLKAADLAAEVGVDPKTVERWITRGRLPHRSHRMAVADALGVDETYIWPEVLTAPATQAASVAELLTLHPSRAAVPHDTWRQLIAGTREALDLLMYAATFLFEQHNITEIADQATRGSTR